MADSRPAVFLDRDGTVIEDPGYVHDPAAVKLLPGAAEAIRRLNTNGYAVVTVSNQSGIARGYYQDADYLATQQRLEELLASAGARVDGAYYCPHHPDFTGPCDCRKPGVKLFREAAAALDIDLARSWWVGDRMTDVQPAATLGGRGILLAGRKQGAGEDGVTVVADLRAAVDEILRPIKG